MKQMKKQIVLFNLSVGRNDASIRDLQVELNEEKSKNLALAKEAQQLRSAQENAKLTVEQQEKQLRETSQSLIDAQKQ